MHSTKAIRLALALGWKYEQFVRPERATDVSVLIKREDNLICSFSLKDKHLMWELMVRLNLFPTGFKTIEGMKYHVFGVNKAFSCPLEAVYEAAMIKLGAKDV